MTRGLSLAICLGLFLTGQAAAPDPRFGAIQSYQAPDLAAGAGVGWDRLIVHWSVRQPDDPGQWIVPGEESAALDRARAAGREVVILLMGTPAWATDGRPEIGVPRGLDLPVDDPGNAWAAFVRHVVGDYRGRVHHWVIWNEPDIAAPMDDPLYPASPLVQVTMDEQASFIIQANALALASLTVDLRITQIVNDMRGVHAFLPDGAIT